MVLRIPAVTVKLEPTLSGKWQSLGVCAGSFVHTQITFLPPLSPPTGEERFKSLGSSHTTEIIFFNCEKATCESDTVRSGKSRRRKVFSVQAPPATSRPLFGIGAVCLGQRGRDAQQESSPGTGLGDLLVGRLLKTQPAPSSPPDKPS